MPGALSVTVNANKYMQPDPIIYTDLSRRAEDKRFQDLVLNWKAAMVYIVVAMVWMIIKTDIRREPELPNRPFTKADVPLLQEKVKFLKADADTASSIFPHLKDRAEVKAANQAWGELYYTPEIFPAAEDLRRIQFARLLQLRPDLADHVKAKQAYEEGRYKIANDPAIVDKDAAIEAMKEKIGPEVKDPEYSKNAKEATDVLSTLIGDPELDQAEEAYQQACATAILKRHPELAEYYRELEIRDDSYRYSMSQANALSRQITALENGAEPTQLTTAKPEAPAAEAEQVRASDTPANPPAAISLQPRPSAPIPAQARQYGVAPGDLVDISAVTPPIAFNRAKLTAMNNDHLTVRVDHDVFTVRWPDLIHLKKASAAK